MLDDGGIAKLLSSSQPEVLRLIKMQMPLPPRPEQAPRSGGFVVVVVVVYLFY